MKKMATRPALKNPPPVIVLGIPVAKPRKSAAGRRELTLVLGALSQRHVLLE